MITISSTRVTDLLGEAVAMVEPDFGSSLPFPVRVQNFHAAVIAVAPLGATDITRRDMRAASRRTNLMATLPSSSAGIEHLIQTGQCGKPFDPAKLEPPREVQLHQMSSRALSSDQLAYAVAEWRWRSACVVAALKDEVETRTRDAFIPAWFFEGA